MVKIKTILLLNVLLLLQACSLFSPGKTYEVQKYRLSALNKSHFSANKRHKTLMVSQPTAAAGYQTASMMYMQKPYELGSFVKNEWVAPPAEMLFPLIVQSLRNAGPFDAVVSAPFSGKTDYRLDTKLVQLDQNFISRPSQIILVLQADLVDNDSNTVIASRRFMSKVPTPSDNPYGGVQAANQAVGQVMRQLSQFIAKS